MLDQEQTKSLKETFLGMQIICGSLMMGAVVACIVIYFVNPNRQSNTDIGLMTMLGIVMAVGTFAAAVIVPGIMRKSSAKSLASALKGDGEKASFSTLKLFGQHLTQSAIVRFALIEGTIFANLMFWFVEGSVFSWAVIAAGLALMACFFPFPNRTCSDIESMIAESRSHS